jgi:Glycosyl transferases group 1
VKKFIKHTWQVFIVNRLLYLILFLSINEAEAAPLKINIFSEKNGRGLETDQKILAKVLTEMGHRVQFKNFYDFSENVSVDINIFFEVVTSSATSQASFNWFIPNPEWYVQSLETLNTIDLILCRTKEVERIFKALNKKTFLLGFTSLDCYCSEITKNFSSLLHLAGGSMQKGTPVIVDVWMRNPLLPLLLVIKHNGFPSTPQSHIQWIDYRVDDAALRYFQNTCGIHLCLSETEGFGHYIMEAMSAGAVVVTTNAPPMNEFIVDLRCLVSYERTCPQRLATNYYAHPDSLAATIDLLNHLPVEELCAIGLNNRRNYLKITATFKKRLKILLLQVAKSQSEL